MTRILKIDRAKYEADDSTRTYWYHSRNSEWKKLGKEENEENKKHIDGYSRIFPNGTRKVFKFKGK